MTAFGAVLRGAGRGFFVRSGLRILRGFEEKSRTECGFSCELWVRS
jgi:hypothetical protein